MFAHGQVYSIFYILIIVQIKRNVMYVPSRSPSIPPCRGHRVRLSLTRDRASAWTQKRRALSLTILRITLTCDRPETRHGRCLYGILVKRKESMCAKSDSYQLS